MIQSILIPHKISHETHISDTARKRVERSNSNRKKVGDFPSARQRWEDTL